MFVRFNTSLEDVIVNTDKIIFCSKSDSTDNAALPRFSSHSYINILFDEPSGNGWKSIDFEYPQYRDKAYEKLIALLDPAVI